MVLRKDLQRELITLETISKVKDMTEANRVDLNKKIDRLKILISDTSGEITIEDDEKYERRKYISENPGLKSVFDSFWFTVRSFTSSDEIPILTKKGYVSINELIQLALVGYKDHDELLKNAVHDWKHDISVHGPITEVVFYDILYDIIDTWTEIVDPLYYTAFTWALLDAIADTRQYPPRLRNKKGIKCIMKSSNEASMIRDYILDKPFRNKLIVDNECLKSIPDIQKRLLSRRVGTTLSENDIETIAALMKNMDFSSQNNSENRKNNVNDSDSDISDSDNDSIISDEFDEFGHYYGQKKSRSPNNGEGDIFEEGIKNDEGYISSFRRFAQEIELKKSKREMTRHEYLYYNKGEGDGKFLHHNNLGVQEQAKIWSTYSGSVSALDYECKYDIHGHAVDGYGKRINEGGTSGHFVTGNNISGNSTEYQHLSELYPQKQAHKKEFSTFVKVDNSKTLPHVKVEKIIRKEKLDNRQVKSKSKVVDPLLVPLTKEQMKQKLNKLNKKEEKERNSMIELKANFKASRSRSLENNAKELTKEALELDQKQSDITEDLKKAIIDIDSPKEVSVVEEIIETVDSPTAWKNVIKSGKKKNPRFDSFIDKMQNPSDHLITKLKEIESGEINQNNLSLGSIAKAVKLTKNIKFEKVDTDDDENNSIFSFGSLNSITNNSSDPLPEKRKIETKIETKNANMNPILNVLKIAKRMTRLTKSHRSHTSGEQDALLAIINKFKEDKCLSLENPDKLSTYEIGHSENNIEIIKKRRSSIRKSVVVGGFISSKTISDLILARNQLKESDEEKESNEDAVNNDISKGSEQIMNNDLDIDDKIIIEPIHARHVSKRTSIVIPTNRPTINRPKEEVNKRNSILQPVLQPIKPTLQMNESISQSILIQNIPKSQKPSIICESVPIEASIDSSRERTSTCDDILSIIVENIPIEPINLDKIPQSIVQQIVPELSIHNKAESRPTSVVSSMKSNQQKNKKLKEEPHLSTLSLDDALSNLFGAKSISTSTTAKSRTQSLKKMISNNPNQIGSSSLCEAGNVIISVSDQRPKSPQIKVNQIIEEPKKISAFAHLKSTTFLLSEIIPLPTDVEIELERAKSPYNKGYQPERFNNKLALNGLDGYKEVPLERTRSPSPHSRPTTPITSNSHPTSSVVSEEIKNFNKLDVHQEEDETDDKSLTAMLISNNALNRISDILDDHDDLSINSADKSIRVFNSPSNSMVTNILPISPGNSIYEINNLQTPALGNQPIQDKIYDLTGKIQEVQYINDLVVDPSTKLLKHDSYITILNESTINTHKRAIKTLGKGFKSNILNPLPTVKFVKPIVENDRVPMNNRGRYREKYEKLIHTISGETGLQNKKMKEKKNSDIPLIKKVPLIRLDESGKKATLNDSYFDMNDELIPIGKHITSKSELQDRSQEDMLISDYIHLNNENIDDIKDDVSASNYPKQVFKNVSKASETNFTVYRSNRVKSIPKSPIRNNYQNLQTGKPILDGIPLYQGGDEIKNISLSIKRVTTANYVQIDKVDSSMNSLEQASIVSINPRIITKDTYLDLYNEDVKEDRNPTPITYPNPRPYTSPDKNFNNPNPFIGMARTEVDPFKIDKGPSGNVKKMYNDFSNLTVSIIPEPENPHALKLLESQYYDDVVTESTNQPVLIIKNLNDRKREERYYGTLYHSVSDNTYENQIPTYCGGLGIELSGSSVQYRTGIGTKMKNRIAANPNRSLVSSENKNQLGKNSLLLQNSFVTDDCVNFNNTSSSCEIGDKSLKSVYIVNKSISEGLIAPPWIPESANIDCTKSWNGHDRSSPWNAYNDKKLMEKCSLSIGDPTSTLMKIKMNPAKKEAFELFSRPFNKGISKYVPRETNDFTQYYRESTPVTRSIIPQTIGLKNQIQSKKTSNTSFDLKTNQSQSKSNNNNDNNNNNDDNNSNINSFCQVNDSENEETESLMFNVMLNTPDENQEITLTDTLIDNISFNDSDLATSGNSSVVLA